MGEAMVLSTSVVMPRARAMSDMRARSVRRSIGLDGLSSTKRRVSGRAAAAKPSASAWSTKLTSMPSCGAMFCSRPVVPPYSTRCATTWSPRPAKASSAAVMAPMPEAVASAHSPPSSPATADSNARVVGLP